MPKYSGRRVASLPRIILVKKGEEVGKLISPYKRKDTWSLTHMNDHIFIFFLKGEKKEKKRKSSWAGEKKGPPGFHRSTERNRRKKIGGVRCPRVRKGKKEEKCYLV